MTCEPMDEKEVAKVVQREGYEVWIGDTPVQAYGGSVHDTEAKEMAEALCENINIALSPILAASQSREGEMRRLLDSVLDAGIPFRTIAGVPPPEFSKALSVQHFLDFAEKCRSAESALRPSTGKEEQA